MINKLVSFFLNLHKSAIVDKCLFMQIVSVLLVVYQPYPSAILGHENINITIVWIVVVSGTDYLGNGLGFASHVVKTRKKEESLQP